MPNERKPTIHEIGSRSVWIKYLGAGEWDVNGQRIMFSGNKDELVADLRKDPSKLREPGVWYREGSFLFVLKETGDFRSPLVNEFVINIDGGRTDAARVALAEEICRFLNKK